MRAKEFITENIDTNSSKFRGWFGKSKVVDKKGKPMIMYHGSASEEEFIELQDFSHFGTLQAADDIIDNQVGSAEDWPIGASRIYPVYLKIENPIKFVDKVNENWSSRDLWKRILENGIPELGLDFTNYNTLHHLVTVDFKKQLANVTERDGLIHFYTKEKIKKFVLKITLEDLLTKNSPKQVMRLIWSQDIDAVDWLKSKGFDGIKYKNMGEDRGSISWIAFTSGQIKTAI